MKKWRLLIDDKVYRVVYKPDAWLGKHKLTINGEEVPLKCVRGEAFVGSDRLVMIGSKRCHLVTLYTTDLAVDGVYLDSKKRYVPLAPMPRWAWVFVALCATIPISAAGGAIPALLGLAGAMGCTRKSVCTDIKTSRRVLFCTGLTLLVWALFVAFAFGISYLQAVL